MQPRAEDTLEKIAPSEHRIAVEVLVENQFTQLGKLRVNMAHISSHRHRGLDVRMRIVVIEADVINGEGIDLFHQRIDP